MELVTIAAARSRNGVTERRQTLSRLQDPMSFLPREIDNHSVKRHIKKLRPGGRPTETTKRRAIAPRRKGKGTQE